MCQEGMCDECLRSFYRSRTLPQPSIGDDGAAVGSNDSEDPNYETSPSTSAERFNQGGTGPQQLPTIESVLAEGKLKNPPNQVKGRSRQTRPPLRSNAAHNLQSRLAAAKNEEEAQQQVREPDASDDKGQPPTEPGRFAPPGSTLDAAAPNSGMQVDNHSDIEGS